MDYLVEVIDTWGRRIASYDEVPLLKATRGVAFRADRVEGILPGKVSDLSAGYRIRVSVDGVPFCDVPIEEIRPQWSDTRKLVLDRFVHFHEIVDVEGQRDASDGNATVTRAFTNRTIGQIVRQSINTALGSVHYWVDHTAYPDGANREFTKFSARKQPGNALEVGGISQGQWVDSTRIDVSGAFAKDGDTIAGLVVDGVAWPDLRLMLIDSEETSINSHTIKLHPEVAGWSAAQYANSGYKVRADAATAFLQSLMDAKGIDFIELNPHVDSLGNFDDRVDAFGRYLGFVYGGGECFNAAMVEQDHALVLLYEGGKFHVPEMELKDYFSYGGPHTDSIEEPSVSISAFDVSGGLFETLTALAYMAGGYVWSVDSESAVRFREAIRVDRVVFFNPLEHRVALGSDARDVANTIFFDGNPLTAPLSKTYRIQDSIDEYGEQTRFLNYFSISVEADADRLVNGLLDDIAYPEPAGEVEFLNGDGTIAVGDIVSFRDGDLRRLERAVAGEWGGRFAGELVGRVREVTHVFRGRRVSTTARLTSPLRSVSNPERFVTRGQVSAANLFQFRLDDTEVGLDLGYHLD